MVWVAEDSGKLVDSVDKSSRRRRSILWIVFTVGFLIVLVSGVTLIASMGYSTTRDVFRVTGIRSVPGDSRYRLDVENGSCSASTMVYAKEAEQLNVGDYVEMLVITNDSGNGKSAVTVSLSIEGNRGACAKRWRTLRYLHFDYVEGTYKNLGTGASVELL